MNENSRAAEDQQSVNRSEMMDDDGVIVTGGSDVSQRPDSTAAQEAAETKAQEVIKDLDAGLVSRRSAINVKRAAKRAISGADLRRGLRNLACVSAFVRPKIKKLFGAHRSSYAAYALRASDCRVKSSL